jgi:hypothetical protein
VVDDYRRYPRAKSESTNPLKETNMTNPPTDGADVAEDSEVDAEVIADLDDDNPDVTGGLVTVCAGGEHPSKLCGMP